METLLIPALLDHHWPLLRWAFETRNRRAIVLEEDGAAVEALGLRHLHNDLCYPFHLIAGQVLAALRSGRCDPDRTSVLISQSADGCRGSCLIHLLRAALDREGFGAVTLLSLNARGMAWDHPLPVTPGMALRAVAAAFWGDALLLLGNQTRPREASPGETNRRIARWTKILSDDLKKNRNLTPWGILRRCREMSDDFRRIPQGTQAVQRIAVVGDLYTKYCRLGNWNLETFLERRGCEAAVNGLTWYALYYMDTHLDRGLLLRPAGQVLTAAASRFQRRFVRLLRKAGFLVLPPYPELKRLAPASCCALGSGWLLAAEATAWSQAGTRKILSGLPFGCLPGHIYGRGQYASLQRTLPGTLLVGVDYDTSIPKGSVQDRIQMLLDMEPPC